MEVIVWLGSGWENAFRLGEPAFPMSNRYLETGIQAKQSPWLLLPNKPIR